LVTCPGSDTESAASPAVELMFDVVAKRPVNAASSAESAPWSANSRPGR
jgi:hypothetical protein